MLCCQQRKGVVLPARACVGLSCDACQRGRVICGVLPTRAGCVICQVLHTREGGMNQSVDLVCCGLRLKFGLRVNYLVNLFGQHFKEILITCNVLVTLPIKCEGWGAGAVFFYPSYSAYQVQGFGSWGSVMPSLIILLILILSLILCFSSIKLHHRHHAVKSELGTFLELEILNPKP